MCSTETNYVDFAEMVRCIARDDWGTYDQITQRINEKNGWDGWSEFLAASFLVAVEQRFTRSTQPTEIIQFVADARTEFSASGSDVDPTAVEAMINTVFNRANTSAIDSRTIVQVEILVVRKILKDSNSTGDQLDAFLAKADGIRTAWSAPDE
jgi:hypothetical protein